MARTPISLVSRLRSVLNLDRGGRPQGAVDLHTVLRRLVERLYFADFHVAEQTVVVGSREVTQVLAWRTGQTLRPGVACITRLGVGRDVVDSWESGSEVLPRGLWALLTFLAQVDAASQISMEDVDRSLFLALTVGPPSIVGRSALDALGRNDRGPRWALVSAPTGNDMAAQQPGLLSATIRPGPGLESRIRPRLGGPEVRRVDLFPGSDPLGLATVALLERLMGPDPGAVSVHDVLLERHGEDQLRMRGIVATDAPRADDLENVVPVPDGTPIGPDLQPLLRAVCDGYKRLLRSGVQARLGRIETVAGVPEVGLEVEFTEAEAVPPLVTRIQEAFASEGDETLTVETHTAMPPLRTDPEGSLAEALRAVGCRQTVVETGPSEAGILAGADIETLLFGPGAAHPDGTMAITPADLGDYADRFGRILRRLLSA